MSTNYGVRTKSCPEFDRNSYFTVISYFYLTNYTFQDVLFAIMLVNCNNSALTVLNNCLEYGVKSECQYSSYLFYL